MIYKIGIISKRYVIDYVWNFAYRVRTAVCTASMNAN